VIKSQSTAKQRAFPGLFRSIHPLAVMVIIFAAFPAIPLIGRFLSLGTEVVIWSLFALGFNILLGYTGLTSFGHGAYFGIGAYGAAIAFLRLSHSLWLCLLIGTLVGGLFAALVGLIVANKRGIYFSLLTIAFSQMFFFIAFRWDEFTGGETGLTGIDRQTLKLVNLAVNLRNPIAYYYFVLAVFALCAVIIWRIVHSPFGRVLRAIKENELRAKYLGYNTEAYKWATFTISGLFAALGGSLYTFLINSAYAFGLEWVQSGNVVMMTLLGGGTVSFFGPVVGAAIFITCRDLLSAYFEHWLLFYGLLFVIVILYVPTGILGAAAKLRKKHKG
jgi:branched-chain amino acid transport system permease protein